MRDEWQPIIDDTTSVVRNGEVTSYYDPSAFEWIHRDQIYAAERSLVRIEKSGISITVGTEDEEAMALLGSRVEVGFAKAAIAIRATTRKDAYKLALHHGSVRRGAIRSPKLVREAAKRGFEPGTLLEARWDARSNMLVGVRPKEPKATDDRTMAKVIEVAITKHRARKGGRHE